MSRYNQECDICRRRILHVDHLVNAGTYGAIAHRDCFEALTPRQVIRFLSIDDIDMGPETAYDWERGFFPDGRGERVWAKPDDMPGGRKKPV